MEYPEIELIIDEIKLSGFTNIDEMALQSALQEELQRLIYTANEVGNVNSLNSINSLSLNQLILNIPLNTDSKEIGRLIANWLLKGTK